MSILRERTVKYEAEEYTISAPGDTLKKAREMILDSSQEHMIGIFMDNSNIPHFRLLALGQGNQLSIHPKEIFSVSILLGLSRFILIHNHPSGNMSPSEEDIAFTKKIMQGAKIMGLNFLDHIIISPTESYSFKSNGIL